MKRQQNTVLYLFKSQLKVTIEHISLGKKLVFTAGGGKEKEPSRLWENVVRKKLHVFVKTVLCLQI